MALDEWNIITTHCPWLTQSWLEMLISSLSIQISDTETLYNGKLWSIGTVLFDHPISYYDVQRAIIHNIFVIHTTTIYNFKNIPHICINWDISKCTYHHIKYILQDDNVISVEIYDTLNNKYHYGPNIGYYQIIEFAKLYVYYKCVASVVKGG